MISIARGGRQIVVRLMESTLRKSVSVSGSLLYGGVYHSLPYPDSDEISRGGDARRASSLSKRAKIQRKDYIG